MSNLQNIRSKIFLLTDLKKQIVKWKNNGEKIVFTNGCFDLLHKGHIEVLANTANLGDRLVIGLNSDSSIRNIKGANRPILSEESRSILLAALQFVDAIVIFTDETPEKIIKSIIPDVLSKGGDYIIEEIVGSDIVLQNGGQVILIPFLVGYSSSNIINKIKNG